MIEGLVLPEVEGIPPPADVCVAVVFGGESAEREVSLRSGRMVAEALEQTFPRVLRLEPDRNLLDGVLRADVVFPVLHGPLGEDGSVQGLLELSGVPYVGCGVLASACALDKVMAKRIFRDLGLPVARDVVVDTSLSRDAVHRLIREHVGERVVVKPAREGSAIGVVFAVSEAEIDAALDAAWQYEAPALVEEHIDGAEITVGILETDAPRPFPVIEVRTPPGSWYDYAHRYTPGLSEHVVPAPLALDVYASVQRLATEAHRGLGCRDLSRADFVVMPGTIRVLGAEQVTGSEGSPRAVRDLHLDRPAEQDQPLPPRRVIRRGMRTNLPRVVAAPRRPVGERATATRLRRPDRRSG